MGKIRISRSALDRLPIPSGGEAVYHFDSALAGFGVRVSPRGVIAYVVQGYAAGGKKHRRTLGRYPLKSPEEARREANAFLRSLGEGATPLRSVKVSEALDRWLAEHGPKLKPRTLADYRQIAAQQIKPQLGHRLVGALVREDVAALHSAMSATPRRANYTLAVCRSFLTWAEEAGLRPLDSNPAKRIRAYPESRRERFLSEAELARAAEAISAAEGAGAISPFAAAALRLAILTGARSGELTGLRWAEVDLERRLLLLSDSKTGRKPIYLSSPAAEILAGLPRVKGNPFVFPGDREGQPYRNLTRAWIKVREVAALGDVRLHDLRHTFASHGAAAGFSLPMIGALLGHRVPATTQRYAHLAAHPVASANEEIGTRLAGIMNGAGRPRTGSGHDD